MLKHKFVAPAWQEIKGLFLGLISADEKFCEIIHGIAADAI